MSNDREADRQQMEEEKRAYLVEEPRGEPLPDLTQMGVDEGSYVETPDGGEAIVVGDEELAERLQAEGLTVTDAPAGHFANEAGVDIWVDEEGTARVTKEEEATEE